MSSFPVNEAGTKQQPPELGTKTYGQARSLRDRLTFREGTPLPSPGPQFLLCLTPVQHGLLPFVSVQRLK